MKERVPVEQRSITVPREFMDFAKKRVTEMLHMNPHQPIRDICAEAYLLAVNDLTQIENLIKAIE